VVGQFIFVRLSTKGMTLENYLGETADFLRQASTGMNKVVDSFEQQVQANWKVVIENSLESYHVPMVHGKSFMLAPGMQCGLYAEEHIAQQGLHSSMEHPLEPDWLARFQQRITPKLGQWAWQPSYYTHRFIFPNLTVTSFMGYTFHVQRFDPLDVNTSKVISRTVGVRFTGQKPLGKGLMDRIYEEGKGFTRQAFAEDQAICEAVHIGVRQTNRKAVLAQDMEARIGYFHSAYLSLLLADVAGQHK
jgi:phenylpropionate dioxygenase-like ring-hydroxylating dioxygenase large terminal subunit